MSKKEFIYRIKLGLWPYLPRHRVNGIVSEYERYFNENKDTNEEELVARCGDVGLIIGENIEGKPTRFLAVRVIILLVVAFVLYQYGFNFPIGFFLSHDGFTFVLNIIFSIVCGVAMVVTMGYPICKLPKFDSKLSALYVANAVFCLFVGIISTFVIFSFITSVYKFDANTISPSNIGLVLFSVLTVIYLLFLTLTILSATFSLRAGLWAMPLIFINIVSLSFYTSLADFLGSLASPELMPQVLSEYIVNLTFELVVKVICFSLLFFVSYRIIRRRNDSTA